MNYLADSHNHKTQYGGNQDAGSADLDAPGLRGQRHVPPGGQRQEVSGRGDQTEHPRHRGVRGLGGSGTTGQFLSHADKYECQSKDNASEAYSLAH